MLTLDREIELTNVVFFPPLCVGLDVRFLLNA